MNRKQLLVLWMLLVSFAGAGALLRKPELTATAMTDAAARFLASLPAASKTTAQLDFAAPLRTDWHFIPKQQRKGLQIREMNPAQRERAMELLRAALSEVGYRKATAVISLEHVLKALESNSSRPGLPLRDAERYYVTVFGEPKAQGKWGWSFEGHHLSLNFTVEDGVVRSVTPAMFGANPAEVRHDIAGGPKKGTRVLEREETLAFELLGSLSAEQRAAAIVADKAPAELADAGKPKGSFGEPRGLAADKLSAAQQKTLWSLIETYVMNMPDEVAQRNLAQIRESWPAGVYFFWAGADRRGVGHYYRVQGPAFVLELVNVQPDAAGNPANHIHSAWRSPLGDFGLSQ